MLQVILRGTLDDLASGFYCLQMCSYLTIYNVPVPSVTEIFIKQFRKLVEFELLQPDSVLSFFNSQKSILDWYKVEQEKLMSSVESTGVISSKFLFNMRTLILITILFWLFLLLLYFFSFFKNRLQALAKELLAE